MRRSKAVHRSLLSAIWACCLLAGCWLPKSASAQTAWFQWGGPNRNFAVSQDSRNILRSQPTLRWKRAAGNGYAAIVTDGQHGFSRYVEGDFEFLEKWRLDDGVEVWSSKSRVDYHASIPEYDGPHSTPIVVDDRIVMASIDAKARAVDLKNGRLLWERDLCRSFGTKLPQAGYACSPIRWRNLVIFPTLGESTPAETETFRANPTVPPGRAAIPGAVALDIRSGKAVWRAPTFRSSHGSPILIEVDQQPMLVFHGMFELLGVDPENGRILWRQLLRREAADNVSFMPIWDAARSQFFISHGYCNYGTQAVKLEPPKGQQRDWRTRIAWTNSKLQIVHTNAVLVGSTLVGTKRPAATLLVGIDVRDGRTLFRQRGYGTSNLLAVGDQLIVLDEDGELVGGHLGQEGLNESWRISALTQKAWTVPSIVGDRLLLRDGAEVRSYDLAR